MWAWLRSIANSIMGKTGKPSRPDTAMRMAVDADFTATRDAEPRGSREPLAGASPIDELTRNLSDQGLDGDQPQARNVSGSASRQLDRARRSRYGVMGRKAAIAQRIEKLIQEFPRYLVCYDERTPFNKPEQLESHIKTIRLRQELGSALRAATNDEFCKSLYLTLQAWGIGKRASNLLSYDTIAARLAERASEIAKLDGITIDNPALDVRQVADDAWVLIQLLGTCRKQIEDCAAHEGSASPVARFSRSYRSRIHANLFWIS